MKQESALAILKSGVNVFLTGEPGSGKTYTINRYIKYLDEHSIKPAITASTGIAATHIGGMTIHSWSGIGIRKTLSKKELVELAGRKNTISRFKKTTVLIIDEISMIDAQTLSTIEDVCKAAKENQMPWGGLQVVFVGDFFQLPPISRVGEEPARFAYYSSSWDDADPAICYLSEQHRQDDPEFFSILTSIRKAEVDEKVHSALERRKNISDSQKEHTQLYTHNFDVDKMNEKKLCSLAGDMKIFEMESRGPEKFVAQLQRGCLSPEKLFLKIGARVMFTKNNFKEGFVNGTIGEVMGFTEEGMPIVHTESGIVVEVEQVEWTLSDGASTLARINQLPLRLAWAITIHKSQGMTLDSAVIDLSGAFVYGQGYVAISRVRALGGLTILGYNSHSLKVDPDVSEADFKFQEQSASFQERFENISLEEQLKKAKEFILKCGGKLKKVEREAKDDLIKKKDHINTYEKTLALWREGKSVPEIADARGIVAGTVISHLEELFMRGELNRDDIYKASSKELISALPEVKKAFEEVGMERLSPVFEKLNKKYSYNDLKIARIIFSEESRTVNR